VEGNAEVLCTRLPHVEGDEFYSVSEAAKVLKVTDRRVRQLASEGELGGERTEAGWKLRKSSAHSFRDGRRAPKSPGWPPDAIERINALERALGRLEGEMKTRLELTEVAESTLRESLERERQRADAERERAERLEAELAEARKSWWRRIFQ
jgi:excisionase family DNA binding protein